MDVLPFAITALLASCVAVFAWGTRHAWHPPARNWDWTCLVCGQRNKFELERC